MIVLVLERVPISLRGELTRWCIEVATGVFVGRVSTTVRELLFEKCIRLKGTGRCVLVHRAGNEQGFTIRMSGDSTRRVADFEGLQLIALTTARASDHLKRKSRTLRAPKST